MNTQINTIVFSMKKIVFERVRYLYTCVNAFFCRCFVIIFILRLKIK